MPVGSNFNQDSRWDPPCPASLAGESVGVHIQATAQMAAEEGWYYRPERFAQLIPDTRRCVNCGQRVFPPLALTVDQAQIRHPLSTQVLLGEDGF